MSVEDAIPFLQRPAYELNCAFFNNIQSCVQPVLTLCFLFNEVEKSPFTLPLLFLYACIKPYHHQARPESLFKKHIIRFNTRPMQLQDLFCDHIICEAKESL